MKKPLNDKLIVNDLAANIATLMGCLLFMLLFTSFVRLINEVNIINHALQVIRNTLLFSLFIFIIFVMCNSFANLFAGKYKGSKIYYQNKFLILMSLAAIGALYIVTNEMNHFIYNFYVQQFAQLFPVPMLLGMYNCYQYLNLKEEDNM